MESKFATRVYLAFFRVPRAEMDVVAWLRYDSDWGNGNYLRVIPDVWIWRPPIALDMRRKSALGYPAVAQLLRKTDCQYIFFATLGFTTCPIPLPRDRLQSCPIHERCETSPPCWIHGLVYGSMVTSSSPTLPRRKSNHVAVTISGHGTGSWTPVFHVCQPLANVAGQQSTQRVFTRDD